MSPIIASLQNVSDSGSQMSISDIQTASPITYSDPSSESESKTPPSMDKYERKDSGIEMCDEKIENIDVTDQIMQTEPVSVLEPVVEEAAIAHEKNLEIHASRLDGASDITEEKTSSPNTKSEETSTETVVPSQENQVPSLTEMDVNGSSTNESPRAPNYPVVIFDIGDVLCLWKPSEKLPIGGSMLQRFRKTRTWFEYDMGLFSQEECYKRLSEQYGVPFADTEKAFNKARTFLVPNEPAFDIIRNLRSTYGNSVRLYLMSNIPREEWESIRQRPEYDWHLFDGYFTSSETGMCKPEIRFFNHVLKNIGAKASEVLLVDDNSENILSARSMGIQCHRYKDPAGLKRFFGNTLQDPIQRGKDYLYANAGQMWCETPQGREVRDNFAQLFLLEATSDMSLVTLTHYERTWNYYIEKPIDTVEKHPDDIDTTSLANILLPNDPVIANSVLDEILTFTTGDGIIMTYFDRKRPRVDPAVCVNALRFFYKYNRGDEPALQPTKTWLSNVLFHRAYINGTYYYPTPDVFLYLFARLLAANPESDLYRMNAALLRERLAERVNVHGDALELALRVIACRDMGMSNEGDKRVLAAGQTEDGSWETGWLCQTGKISLKIGSRGLTTAFAVKALEG